MADREEPLIRVGILTATHIGWKPLPGGRFAIENVVIGKSFHWQRRERQVFTGRLEILRGPMGETAVNILPIEDYLRSVISSEMAATSHPALLRAHAVISRSWAMARILDRRGGRASSGDASAAAVSMATDGAGEVVRWYDADGHEGYDVCADDHCQRYQGVTRITRPEVSEAVDATAGEVLTYCGRLCDARFSKCCGGAFETSPTCWGDEAHPYLRPGRDILPPRPLPDLTRENEARAWISDRPDAFCSSASAEHKAQVLNPYDMERFSAGDDDYYRWRVEYSPSRLREILREKSGIDFGEVTALTPLRRGESGRISLLEIRGTRASVRVGKELEIRRWLSDSHLLSSAFTVSRGADGSWILHGAGWGHGVGLCQIGAAMMATRGYTYREILARYFPGSEISTGITEA